MRTCPGLLAPSRRARWARDTCRAFVRTWRLVPDTPPLPLRRMVIISSRTSWIHGLLIPPSSLVKLVLLSGDLGRSPRDEDGAVGRWRRRRRWRGLLRSGLRFFN
ncbi:hypothetical protein J5N97_010083 [Dioscorea zingiberensis]|uniref:Uncharacterized protein n=1 Tax=Dioscorea zingiberensis TaxID=325984 RepID=A0A9D5HME2_9LILI|nr:hypothetical protein J5N97_010083 [Dioscorea zingiberensis]